MSVNHSRLTIFGILCRYPGVKWTSVEGTVDLETGRRCHRTTKADAANGSALGRVGQRREVSRGSQKSVSRCWSCSPRQGTRSARLSRGTPFSRVVLSLSLSLSVSPFSPEVTTSTPASERKRGRYREENDVLQNVVTPKRRSEGNDAAAVAAAARTDVVHAPVPSVPSVPLSFTTRHDHGDAVRTGGEALAATFPDHHSRNNNNHRDTRVRGTWRRGSVKERG